MISAIVVNWNGAALLRPCLEHLNAAAARAGEEVEVVVVDNASTDGSAELAASLGARVVAEPVNRGFAGGVVRGLEETDGDLVLLVNNDAELEPDALRELVDALRAAPAAGTATSQVRFHDRRDVINTAGIGVDRLGIGYDRSAGAPAADGGEPQDVFGASGCVVLYRREMLEAVGGFDGSFFAFQEDADVAWRAQAAGWRALYVPRSVAYHHGSATAGEASATKYFLVGRNRMRLLAKNATAGQLLRWAWAMLLYDLAYVAFVAVTDRTLAPLRGRLTGLREWRRYRAAGAPTRGPAPLEPPTGPLGAWRQRSAYRSGGA